jgi:membrane protease YdiL (CAAX protease family)
VKRRATLPPVSDRDRSITLSLVAAALVAWVVLAAIFVTLSPERDAGIQMLGALALGCAVGLTLWPVLWTAMRQAPGALVISGRRSALVGLLIVILVILRAIDAVALPVLLFLLVGAVAVEVAMSMRR